jgi:hypothetical protein
MAYIEGHNFSKTNFVWEVFVEYRSGASHLVKIPCQTVANILDVLHHLKFQIKHQLLLTPDNHVRRCGSKALYADDELFHWTPENDEIDLNNLREKLVYAGYIKEADDQLLFENSDDVEDDVEDDTSDDTEDEVDNKPEDEVEDKPEDDPRDSLVATLIQ